MSQITPYTKLPDRNFWRSAVAKYKISQTLDLSNKKFSILPTDTISTAGSCFAQHLKHFIEKEGVVIFDAEPAPPIVSAKDLILKEYGYGLFSARFGNIYTVRQLLQLTEEALRTRANTRSNEEIIWKKKSRYYDSLRPNIQPNGYATKEEVLKHREFHISRVKHMFKETNVFVFTLGLTESWVDRKTGLVYPTCPGVLAGRFNHKKYEFKNFGFNEIYKDFCKFMRVIQPYNEKIKFLLTVSPVPLTATAEDEHVLSASTYSKSVLRAVAGQLEKDFDNVSYFPSYEIITAPNTEFSLFEDNLRSVSAAGVQIVMEQFKQTYTELFSSDKTSQSEPYHHLNDEICEDILLQDYNKL